MPLEFSPSLLFAVSLRESILCLQLRHVCHYFPLVFPTGTVLLNLFALLHALSIFSFDD